MKTRIVHTKVWQDDWFASQSRATRFLFLYLLTNQYNNLSAVFELSDRVMLFETGLTTAELEQAKFDLRGKVYFYAGWVKIANSSRYSNYSGEKNQKALENELADVPNTVLAYFDRVSEKSDSVSIGYPELSATADTPINHKSEIRKEGGVGETQPSSKHAPSEANTLISRFNTDFHAKYQLTPKRTHLIKERLKTFTLAQLETAVERLSQSPWHTGKNDRGWVADPDFLFRSDENVDKALNLVLKSDEKPHFRIADLLEEERKKDVMGQL